LIKLSRDLAALAILAAGAVVFLRASDSAGSRSSSNDHGFALAGSSASILRDSVGCQSKATMERARDLINDHDKDAAMAYLKTRPSGECLLFSKGDCITVTDRAITSGFVEIYLNGIPAIRYWVPNSAVDSDPR
jgi:hypothetical protein